MRAGPGRQEVGGRGDQLAGQAQAGAEDGAVQAADLAQAIAQDSGLGTGRGAYLVAHYGSAAGQCLVHGADAAVEGDERDRFGALGQREAGP